MSPLVCCRGGMIFYRKSGFYGVGLHRTLLLAEKVIFHRCAERKALSINPPRKELRLNHLSIEKILNKNIQANNYLN